MSFARDDGESPTETEVRALMKVLIGVDPHKASLAVAAVDEATGELLERASFPQDRAGLRSLERWAKRFSECRWAVENAGGLGRYLAGRLAGSGESVVDVPPKLSARVRVLSTGNARKNDGLDALATALAASRNGRLAAVDPEAASEVLSLLSERRPGGRAHQGAKPPARAFAGPPPRRGYRDALGRSGRAPPARHPAAKLLVAHPPEVGF
jgi:transposase